MYAATPRTGSTRDQLWSQLGDEILARRAAAGSEGAFTALYARYHGPLLTYCRSILLNAEDAHDATQTAHENALRALPSRDAGRPLRPLRPLRPWLYRIAHNEAVTLLRRRRPHDELGADAEPLSTIFDLIGSTIGGNVPSVLSTVTGLIDQILGSLPFVGGGSSGGGLLGGLLGGIFGRWSTRREYAT